MKRTVSFLALLFAFGTATFAQEKKEGEQKIDVPPAVSTALYKKYSEAKQVTWEKEKGNYEANWGGKSGEDHSVQFTPHGDFIEIVNTIPTNQLPTNAIVYIKNHYKSAQISEAGKVTDAQGKLSYEAEVNRKDLFFDGNGQFVHAEK